MRLSAASAILRSRVGRKLFTTFFVLIAVPVGLVALLAYQLNAYVTVRSATQLNNEVGKTAGINVIDRLRAAEVLLRMYAQQQPGGAMPAALSERLGRVFAEFRFDPVGQGGGARTGAISSIRFLPNVAAGQGPLVQLSVPLENGIASGRVHASYLWENAQSGGHEICFSVPDLAAPFCQGVRPSGETAVRTERQIFLAPYFEGTSLTVSVSSDSRATRHLPLGIAALVANVAGIALLVALICSSVLLRKLTRPLDALSEATEAVLQGDFTRRVHIAGPRTEFTDLANSFNAMTTEVGKDLQLFQVLAQIDRAIMEERPFSAVVQLVLQHIDPRDCGGYVAVMMSRIGENLAPQLLGCARGGGSGGSPGDDERGPVGAEHVVGVDLPVGDTPAQRVWFRLAQEPQAQERAARELQAFRQRLAVALHAEHHHRQLREQATQDNLTGLLNRFGLVEAIDSLLNPQDGLPDSAVPAFAVVYMDLDGFKEINDAYGHDVGDRVLKEVASRLRGCLGDGALAVARPGGDEFVFVVRESEAGKLRTRCETVLASVRRPISVPPRTLQLGASLGLARYPEHGATHDDLLKHADLAMYRAKELGRNTLVEFEHALQDDLAERLALRQDLRGALAAGQMYVVFQPRVGGVDRQVASAEALLRWRHPSKGLVSPDVFIRMAEETGFILELGRWVLRQALEQLVLWREEPNAPVRSVSVNLSPVQLADPGFVGELQVMLRELRVQRGELELEVTEGALIQDIDSAVERLAALRALGVQIALDDFGVGYSAMRYLNRLPFDTLKIDKSFVFAFGSERPALAIASAIVALAKALDKRVVAEGVETPAQADILEGLGVHELQGYLFGRPQTARDLARANWEPAALPNAAA